MKFFVISVLVCATGFSTLAESVQELSSHAFTNAVIVWQAPTNNLARHFWIYRRTLPRIFPQEIISNAIILGSLQGKGLLKPSAHDFYISEPKGPNYPGPIPTLFGIRPNDASFYYTSPDYATGLAKDLPDDETIVKRAWQCATLLGLDPKALVQVGIYTHECEGDQSGATSNNICGRGVLLTRQLDGIPFFAVNDDGESTEGFSIEFGSREKIRFFLLRWSEVSRYKSEPTASPKEIIRSIQTHKIVVLPNTDGEKYFARLKRLANAKKLTIIKITPYYGEGLFEEMPTDNTPSKFATPFAELKAVADLGDSNVTVRILAPISR